MFVIALLEDTVRVAPDQFHLKLPDAIRNEIDRKLANKVLFNVGLCIALEQIISMKSSLILPGDGASHTVVRFRYLVFRPSIGSIITGKIRNCSREGVHVTLGFFDDILIPHTALQHPSRFDETEQAWVWEYPVEDGSKHDLYMDVGEPVKFRVLREIFEEFEPPGTPIPDGPTQQGLSTPATTPTTQEVKVPYKIIGAINESGLGVLSWWDQHNKQSSSEDDDEEIEEENEEQELESGINGEGRGLI